jgi:hypothetical protein
MWAGFNQCKMVPEQGGTLDLVRNVVGEDTTVLRFEPKILENENVGEVSGGVSELWTIHGASHGPRFNHSYSPRIVDWLLAHRKSD